MRTSLFSVLSVLLLGLTLFPSKALADAPLKTVLGLDVEQARQVADIQGGYRREYASKRGVHNREARKLRRARIENDAEMIATQEKIVAQLKAELSAMKDAEDADIREVLSKEQNAKFDAYIAKREAMVGSSRDVRNH